METEKLILVGPEERRALRILGSTLYYRRLILGRLAALERQQTRLVPGQNGEPPQAVIPPAALEAAILGAVLLGWEGVSRPSDGDQVPYSPQAAGLLPAGVRRLVLARAYEL